MYKLFDNNGNLLTNNKCTNNLNEHTYVSNKIIRNQVNKNMTVCFDRNEKTFHNFRLTRIKLDVIIPILFTIIWISFFIYSYLNCQ